ncbi:hypothetical protein CVT26_012981 [Gymnopilus dilepis]|uniref:Uncharacterized protein n=1 Tax=Gymnopilus dilepis TaxID=231916 RepID=A0A409YP21_9AGAR|nr:hypothetical protein CVT26_012981 [Gymnopilus dilepis]
MFGVNLAVLSLENSSIASRIEPASSWESSFQVLRDSDVRSYQDPEHLKPKQRRKGTYEDGEEPDEMDVDVEDSGAGIDLLPENRSRRDGTGRTRLMISWIWTMVSYNADSPEVKDNNLLRAEWARSRVRVNRAKEEVQLLREEMRRVVVYLDWKSEWWKSRQQARYLKDVVLAEGLHSYCVDQENRQQDLKVHFQDIWKTPLKNIIHTGDDEEKGDDDSEDGSDSEASDATDDG